MQTLLGKLKATFATKYGRLEEKYNESNTETTEAYALNLISNNYDFASEERYLDATDEICQLARIVASDDHLPNRERARLRNIQLVVNNQNRRH